MDTMLKRLLALAVALFLVVGLMPWNAVSVYATEEVPAETPAVDHVHEHETVEEEATEEVVEEIVEEVAEEAPVAADAITFECKHCNEEVEWLPLNSQSGQTSSNSAGYFETDANGNNFKSGH